MFCNWYSTARYFPLGLSGSLAYLPVTIYNIQTCSEGHLFFCGLSRKIRLPTLGIIRPRSTLVFCFFFFFYYVSTYKKTTSFFFIHPVDVGNNNLFSSKTEECLRWAPLETNHYSCKYPGMAHCNATILLRLMLNHDFNNCTHRRAIKHNYQA